MTSSTRFDVRALRAACVLALASCGGGDGADVARASARPPLREDPRVAELFYDCAREEPYLRDTSDVLPILIEKLEVGQKEPLRRAKEELMGMGQRAADELERYVQRHFATPAGSVYLQNALEVLGAIENETSTRVLLRGLDHPAPEVRNRALRSLARRPLDASEYDRLRVHLDLESPEVQPLVAAAMHRADPTRAELEFLDWFTEGRYPALWPHVAPLVQVGEADPVTERAAELLDDAPPPARAAVATAAARGGDEEALALLAEMAAGDSRGARLDALGSFAELGDVERVGRFLREDPSEVVRGAAVRELARLGAHDALVTALDDGAPGVREEARRILLGRGDEAARDRSLAALSSPSQETVRSAVEALRGPMRRDPDLARAAFERLRARYERELGRSPSARKHTLAMIGQVPAAAAARLCIEAAETIEEDEVDGLAPHRWCALQASNSGEPGQAWLIERLGEEEHPSRRLDLLWAIAAQRNDPARDVLADLVSRPATNPYERLYAASLLVKLGPAARVAPVLKQAVLRVEDVEVRLAMQCLLWRWY